MMMSVVAKEWTLWWQLQCIYDGYWCNGGGGGVSCRMRKLQFGIGERVYIGGKKMREATMWQ